MKVIARSLTVVLIFAGVGWTIAQDVQEAAKQTLESVKQEAEKAQASPATEVKPDSAPKEKSPEELEKEKKAAEAKAKAEEEQRRQQLIQRLQQMQYDRRPSAILKAWSEDGKESPVESTSPGESASPAMPVEEVPMPISPPSEGTPGQPSEGANPSKKDEIGEKATEFSRWVTLGQWENVKSLLATLPADGAKRVYQQMLQSFLTNQPPQNSGMGMPNGRLSRGSIRGMNFIPNGGNMQQMMMEAHSFRIEDVLGLVEASPAPVDWETLTRLGGVLRLALSAGRDTDQVVTQLKSHIEKKVEGQRIDNRLAARLLAVGGRSADILDFIPTIEKAVADNDGEALNLLAIHYIERQSEEGRMADAEMAWRATLAVLSIDKTSKEDREASMQRAVALAPNVREELGEAWLEESFTTHADRGKQLLASIGSLASTTRVMMAGNSSARLNHLKFQSSVAETLLKRAPELADEWSEPLTLLQSLWLAEADLSFRFDTSSVSGPQMQRDIYGNVFWSMDIDQQQQMMMQQQGFAPIPAVELVKIRPSDDWILRTDSSLAPPTVEMLAKLHLKLSEEDIAFPFIERLAKTHKDRARDLADEFLRLWTESHDPNSSRNRRNPYIWFYGYEQRADGIPLTRSKQERNLVELKEMIARLRALDLGEIDENLLAGAFTTCHSSAEVYRLDALEGVFGSIDSLKPATLSSLLQQMRGNLASVWRAPSEQEKAKTNRRQKDIEAEIKRGYASAINLAETALKHHPEDWSLQLVKAAVMHDQIAFDRELDPTPDYVPRRRAALAEFKSAAERYVASVAQLPEEKRSNQAFDMWFYASLGGCDLGQISDKDRAALDQFPLIKKAMDALPGEAAEWHRSRFARDLFHRMSNAKPAIKVRYLDAGFEIVGDHESAAEAKQVFDYYKDLVTEIKLDAVIDGSNEIVAGKPFGLFVNINHTKEIERESGGFKKYLQNQNSSRGFFWNYGRPLEDYRDKFTSAVKEAVEEHFEVLSVTFNHEDANSKASHEYGWRVTPYCYVLLKAKGPQVDKIAPLRLDFDFLDTSGFVVIPIATPTVPVSAKSATTELRPAKDIKITQTLDERQADQGKLILDIKATAQGLVPDLEQLLDVKSITGFVADKIDVRDVSVVEFVKEIPETAVASERVWQVVYKADPSRETRPSEFIFPVVNWEGATITTQRYNDADIVPAEAVVSLEKEYGKPSLRWVYVTLGGLVVLVALGVAIWLARRSRKAERQDEDVVPESLTPFTAIELLRAIENKNGFSAERQVELSSTIRRIEEYYFAEASGPEPDIRLIAREWLGRARSSRTHLSS